MTQNWKCPTCLAINHRRRKTCWECGYGTKMVLPAKPSAPLLRPNPIITTPPWTLSDKAGLFVLSLGAFVWSVMTFTESLRKPNISFDRWSIIYGIVLFVVGLLSSAVFGKRVVIIEASLVLLSGVTYAWVISQNLVDTNLAETASAVCQGRVLPNSPEYNPQAGNHPMVIVYQSTGKSLKASDYPAGWLPPSISDVQLVACIEESWDRIERCDYEDDSFMDREQHSLLITVWTASQGLVLDRSRLYGSLPRECKLVERFEEDQKVKTERGNEVSLQQMLEHLASVMNQ